MATLDIITAAIARLRPAEEDLAGITMCLGVVAATAASDTVMPEVAPHRLPSGDGHDDIAPTGPLPAERLAPSRVIPPRVTRIYRLPAPDVSGPPAWLVQHDSAMSASIVAQPPAMQLLTPAHAARGIVKALLAAQSPTGPIDINRAITDLAQGIPVSGFRRGTIANLARGAILINDRGGWSAPFAQDLTAMLASLRAIVGRGRLRIVICADGPPNLRDAAAILGRIDAGTPVLLLSDLGLSSGPDTGLRAGSPRWAVFARTMRERGGEPIGLLPFPPDRWPAELAEAVSLLHWTPATSPRDARRARENGRPPASHPAGVEEVARLTLAAAAAARIEPALLRALRLALLPQSSPAVEADVWWSEAVSSRGAAAISVTPETLAQARDAPPNATRRAAIDVVSQVHGHSPPGLRAEERLRALLLDPGPHCDRALRTELQDQIRVILEAEAPDATLEFARYVHAFLPRLPLPESVADAASDLSFAAAEKLGAIAVPARTGGATVSPWLRERITQDAPLHQIDLDWRADGIFLTEPARPTRVIEVKGARPALRVADGGDWMPLRQGDMLPGTLGDRVLMDASDGSRWCIEDADAADALAPLRVMVIVHPEDRTPAVESYLAELETMLRAHAGLPAASVVIMRQFQIESWSDLPDWQGRPPLSGGISTWRSATTTAAKFAGVFLVIGGNRLAEEDWTHEALRTIEQVRRGDERKKVAARPLFAVTGFGGASLLELVPALEMPPTATHWHTDEGAAPANLAVEIVEHWRKGPSSAERVPELARGYFESLRDDLIGALQGLVMAFHVRSISTRDVYDDHGNPRGDIWGLEGTPPEEWNGGTGDYADYAHVRFMAEYIYHGPVRDYLHGKDFFAPAVASEALAIGLVDGNPGRSAALSYDHRIENLIEHFEALAPAEQVAHLKATLGHKGSLSEWVSANALTQGDPIVATLAKALLPYTAPIFGLLRHARPSFGPGATFPEYLETVSGLLIGYLRSVAIARPEAEMTLDHPNWTDHGHVARDLFPACFEYLNLRERRGISKEQGMPIAVYADLVADLSDLLIYGVRAHAPPVAGGRLL